MRHAESVANIKNFETSDAGDDLLTELGKKQASEFARNYTESPILIVSSSYNRAKETAQPLLDLFPKVKYEEWNCIHEFSYLKKYTKAEERRNAKKNFWNKQDPTFRDCEYTESFSELISRIDKTLGKLVKIRKSPVIIFSHAKFMRMIILRLIHPKTVNHAYLMKMLTLYNFRFDYCGTLEIYIDDEDFFYLKER